mmetsp:Transcript_11349/g.21657  ORF Transcript_11349/g.21657 Transcript_11349/m.21657 type:complete len:261 (+) Transcript_11349:429-1211(+)
MVIFTARVAKPKPESKLGIKFSEERGKIVITSIADESLFASTALAVGHEILSVNETRVVGSDVGTVLSILTSIPNVVTIEAYAYSLFHLTYQESKVRIPDGEGGVYIKTKFEVTSERSIVPPLLAEMGVTPAKWAAIVDTYSNKLLPAMYESNQMDKKFDTEMEKFVGKQMVAGGLVGFGTESNHERLVFRMAHQSSVLADNCHLLATNLLAQANALLNAHGILAQLTFSTTKIPKLSKHQKENNVTLRPNGVEFLSLTD